MSAAGKAIPLALVLSALTMIGGAAQAAEVTVVRGGKLETVSVPAQRGSGDVQVIRGQAAPAAQSPPKHAQSAAVAAPSIIAVGGKRLWTLDQNTGRVTACFLANTTQVGERVIRCVDYLTR